MNEHPKSPWKYIAQIVFWLCFFGLIALFGGEPDLQSAFVQRLETCK